jgi:diaminohydroxyphosphoribosylaminopyrimidine deaminase / 5-amino-6-(5-phosphoribosylamino)uracil reductase
MLETGSVKSGKGVATRQMTVFTENDAHWMQYACNLAETVIERQVSPNPRVGCVVLDQGGQLAGQGWHHQAGAAHAEVNALVSAGPKSAGGTAYVTLEPCNHTGKTPPCTQALIQAGVSRVVFGMLDPNPLVAGQGVDALKRAGIQVDGPCLPEVCRALNPQFLYHIVHHLPFTAVKVATTLDGYMVDRLGKSQWITGESARQHGHEQRNRFTGIVSTAATVLADNSRLTVRLANDHTVHTESVITPAKQPPTRVILDRQARLPAHPTLAIWHTHEAPTWILTEHPAAYAQAMHAQGAQHPLPSDIRIFPVATGATLTTCWQQLYAAGLTSLWVEAGPRLTSALLAEATHVSSPLVQQLWWYRAGKLLGDGQAAIQWALPHTLATAPHWTLRHTKALHMDTVSVWEK